ncbi:hypothetical protein KJ742_01700 [Patescibacteria group bacterium]|nr:hypothetical protein [Patescibacteria group bacterium]
MNKQEIIKKYKGKVLGEACYKIQNDKIYVDYLVKTDWLLHFLYDMDCGENVLTEDGLNFLKEYYGLNAIADMIIKDIEDGVDFKFQKKEDITDWLERLGY